MLPLPPEPLDHHGRVDEIDLLAADPAEVAALDRAGQKDRCYPCRRTPAEVKLFFGFDERNGRRSFARIANFIANDKPLLVEYQGDWYFPVLKRYPETVFGGEFPLEANYKSPYIRELIEAKQGWMLWPPIPFSYSSINYDLKTPAPAPPA